jgi:putative alpha-1,2-mannosidase
MVVRLGGKRRLTIHADGASRLRQYIHAATLNGNSIDTTWLPSRALRKGGTLTFALGVTPDESWGSDPSAAPPSVG